jgi:N-acetylglucosamine-6-phosphate deacetylase
MSTHLGNGAHAQIRRHPNYIWEQLGCDDLHASLIADGHHLPPSVVKCMVRAKGAERVALVSDAVSLGGMPPGRYASGRLEVLDTGKIVVADTPYLAGAGHLLDTCIANAIRFSDLTLAQAVRCATAIPAQLLGLDQHKGHLRIGADADLTLFRLPEHGPLEIEATLLGGEVIYRRS